jgi:hypothetical protein
VIRNAVHHASCSDEGFVHATSSLLVAPQLEAACKASAHVVSDESASARRETLQEIMV